ncbi:MAG TPA: class I SAM-dependent methyltransferase [Nevskiaceae bacterium]|nr:class I SAM-dependent methyltransferase [Nevskiaceae bacterium]
MSEIELHRKLLGDAARNAAFHAALQKVIVPGKSTVADLGAGTGFLSFLALQLGAKHATLVEYSETLGLAEYLARKNKLTALTFMHMHSSEVKKPPKCDVVVSETLGNYALEENLLETLVDARRWLAPGGTLIPARLKQYVAPVMHARLQDEIDVWPRVGYGLDLTPARAVALNNMYVKRIMPDDLGPAGGAPGLWDDIDFNPKAAAPSSQREGTVQWRPDSALTIHGYALWWECELLPGISIGTSPYAPATHWEQVYLPLMRPLEVRADDTLEVKLTSDTRPQVGVRVCWRTRLTRAGKSVSEQSQDTLRGRL